MALPMRKSRIGTGLDPTLIATERPTAHDIAWAAGLWEGEGSVHLTRTGEVVSLSQADTWVLERFRALFGGRISLEKDPKGQKFTRRPVWRWRVCGPRARGFVQTILKFLSPRRKAQVARCLVDWRYR